jgi:hypothetical protein
MARSTPPSFAAPIYLASTAAGELVTGALVETALEGVSYMATTENGTYHLRLWTPEHMPSLLVARVTQALLTSADLKERHREPARFDIQLPTLLYGTVVEREGQTDT